MIPSPFFLGAAWLVIFCLFSGIGLTVRRWMGMAPPARIEHFFSCFWVGLAMGTFALQVWHLVAPVNMAAFFVVLAWGCAGLWQYARHLRRQPRLTKKQKKALAKGLPSQPRLGWSFYLPALGFAWIVAFYAASLPVFYDAGLYHLPAIRWVTSFPVVPGLGNLHARLAFNQTYFLYAGLLEVWTGRGTHLANSTLLLVALLQFWISFLRILRPVDRRRPVDIFQALMLPFILHQVFLIFMPSPSPDLAVMVLAIICSSLLLQLLENSEDDAPETPWFFYSFFTLILLGITTKITFLIYAATSFLILFIIMWRSRRAILLGNTRRLVWGIIITGLFAIIPWFVHGVIQSGWLIYPLPYGKFDVDWRMPKASLEAKQMSIITYAQDVWKKVGAYHKNVYVIMPLVLAALGLIPNVVTFFRKKTAQTHPALWLLPIPCIATLIHWYVQVPNLRFGYAFFAMLPAMVFALWLRALKNPSKIVAAYLLLFACAIAYDDIAEKRTLDMIQKNRVIRQRLANVWRPDKLSWLVEQIYLPYVTHSGLLIFVPIKDDRCWDTNQLCTPYVRRDLRLRRPPWVRYGFRLDSFDEDDAAVGFVYDPRRAIPSLNEI